MPYWLHTLMAPLKGLESGFARAGLPLLILFMAVIALWQARKRVPAFSRWCGRHPLRVPLNARRAMLLVLAAASVLAYLYCSTCDTSLPSRVAGHDSAFLHVLVSMSIKLLPYFTLGVLFAAAIGRYMKRKGSRWLPGSMLGAAAMASVLPICSCAAVPFSYALMATNRVRLRSVITFMFVVPVLNPFVIAMSWGMLGWEYTVLRIVSIIGLGMVTGVLIERFVGNRGADGSGPATACKGCSSKGMDMEGDTFTDVAYGLLLHLTPYMMIGAILGAALTVFLPTFMVGGLIGNGVVGLLVAVLIGIPIYLCSGEDVLILVPLMAAGLPMGHAIALTIAGNGICLSSIALLVPLFGKRATYWIVASFFIGSLIIGLAINAFA